MQCTHANFPARALHIPIFCRWPQSARFSAKKFFPPTFSTPAFSHHTVSHRHTSILLSICCASFTKSCCAPQSSLQGVNTSSPSTTHALALWDKTHRAAARGGDSHTSKLAWKPNCSFFRGAGCTMSSPTPGLLLTSLSLFLICLFPAGTGVGFVNMWPDACFQRVNTDRFTPPPCDT